MNFFRNFKKTNNYVVEMVMILLAAFGMFSLAISSIMYDGQPLTNLIPAALKLSVIIISVVRRKNIVALVLIFLSLAYAERFIDFVLAVINLDFDLYGLIILLFQTLIAAYFFISIISYFAADEVYRAPRLDNKLALIIILTFILALFNFTSNQLQSSVYVFIPIVLAFYVGEKNSAVLLLIMVTFMPLALILNGLLHTGASFDFTMEMIVFAGFALALLTWQIYYMVTLNKKNNDQNTYGFYN